MSLVALWPGVARGATLARPSLAPARARAGRAAGLHRDRGRLDRHRGRPPAVDHPRRHAHRGRGHADAGARRAVPRVHALYVSSASWWSWLLRPAGAREPADAPRSDAGVTAAHRASPSWLAGVGRWWRSPPTCCSGGADFGGGVWDLLACGPRAAASSARSIARRDRADLGGEPRLADPRGRAAVHVLPARRSRALSIALHIPLTLMLIGIVLRGSAFTFRSHYGHGGERRRRGTSGAGAASSRSRAWSRR